MRLIYIDLHTNIYHDTTRYCNISIKTSRIQIPFHIEIKYASVALNLQCHLRAAGVLDEEQTSDRPRGLQEPRDQTMECIFIQAEVYIGNGKK